MKQHNSSNELKLSIITVCFNSSRTIIDTLNSVRKQKNSGVEYIVIDGGSTDGTIEILKDNQDIINVLISEPDFGIFDAMNKGFRKSTGRFLWFLNSDDYLELNAVEKILGTLDNIGFNKYSIVAGATRLVTLNKIEIRQLKSSQRSYDKRYKFNPFVHPSTVVSRELFAKCKGFDCKFPIASDYDFFLRACLYSPVNIFLDDVISNMREGGASDFNASVKNILNHQVELYKVQSGYISKFYSLTYLILRLFKIFLKKHYWYK